MLQLKHGWKSKICLIKDLMGKMSSSRSTRLLHMNVSCTVSLKVHESCCSNYSWSGRALKWTVDTYKNKNCNCIGRGSRTPLNSVRIKSDSVLTPQAGVNLVFRFILEWLNKHSLLVAFALDCKLKYANTFLDRYHDVLVHWYFL